MNSNPATDSTPEQGKTPPVNGQFPSPATGFREYLVDAIVTFERHDHDASDYDHDFDEVYARRNAEAFIDSAIRANTQPQPEPEKQVAVYGIGLGEWDRMWATLRHVEQLLTPSGADRCGGECSEGHTYARRCEQAPVRDDEGGNWPEKFAALKEKTHHKIRSLEEENERLRAAADTPRDDSEDASRLMGLVTKAYSKPMAEQFDREFPGDDCMGECDPTTGGFTHRPDCYVQLDDSATTATADATLADRMLVAQAEHERAVTIHRASGEGNVEPGLTLYMLAAVEPELARLRQERDDARSWVRHGTGENIRAIVRDEIHRAERTGRARR
ncbi:hypothetical protein K378_01464 [Streptomyces sp. Amel2xB2]|uniref:hypothetical protein n=1 Tax=Streptomyces sp. Amel2xB2 TaxID=1305829 RepID=UPI000DBA3187|nr:hypothetical protein [Streptomyces sp. Amel2xB2]RAJ70299.1 hypothetical protein K378_01464 [Streptomyces sp. Amel2xB2]